MKKNSEVRIQESESRRSFALGVPQARLANAVLSVGDSDPRLIVLHQFVDLVEVLNPVIHPPV
ncbi:MAG: hypothetical protein RMZ41_022365 [Nostoc sp. DedVER02]|uniref:hypothetical protein n=1 Tax=Nostoc sp. DedVER02 TaxID=3075405 RepID=UPI00391A4386